MPLKHEIMTIEVCHAVPVGPSKDLAVPGPLSVALSIARNQGQHRVVTSVDNSQDFMEDARFKNVQIETHFGKRIYGSSWATHFSLGFCRAFLSIPKYNIVHLHWGRSITGAIVALIAQIKRTPLVVQTHGSVKPSNSIGKRFFDVLFTRPLLKRAQKVIALQNVERNWLIELGAEPEKIVIIPNAVWMSGRPLSSTIQWRQNVLFLGHLRPSKGVLDFLRMAKLLLTENSGLHFDVVGADGGDLDNALTLSKNLEISDNVTFHGGLDAAAIENIYRTTRVMVCPSRDEPFNLSAIDAMAHGIPIVISKEFHVWELLQRFGAVVAESLDPADLANEVKQLLNNDEIWGNRCIEVAHIAKELSSDSINDQWQVLYRNLIV